jgi:hypothetical protein
MSKNNRELSQFSAFLKITDVGSVPGSLNPYDGIISIGATEFTGFLQPPAIGIGTTFPRSRLHIALGTTDAIITGDPTLNSGGGIFMDGPLVSSGYGYFKHRLTLDGGIDPAQNPGGLIALDVLKGNIRLGGNVAISHTLSGGAFTFANLNVDYTKINIGGNSDILVTAPTQFGGESIGVSTQRTNFLGIVTTYNKVYITPGFLSASDYISSSVSSGLVVVEGGVGVAGTVTAGYLNSKFVTVESLGSLDIKLGSSLNNLGETFLKNLVVGTDALVGGAVTVSSFVQLNSTEDTSTIGDGALRVYGGASFAKQVRIGTGLSVAGSAELSQGLYVLGGITRLSTPTIVLGASSADDIQFLGRVETSIIPGADAVYDLGTTDFRWNNLRVDNISASTVGIDQQLDVTGPITIGGSATFTSGIFVSGQRSIFNSDIRVNTTLDAETLYVPGVASFNNDIVGTAKTSRRAIAVDVSTASTSGSYYLTFSPTFNAAQEQTLFVDSKSLIDPVTGNVQFGGDIRLNGLYLDHLAGTVGKFNLLNNSVTSVEAFSGSLSVGIGNTVGFTTIKSDKINLLTNSVQIGLAGTAGIRAFDGRENITITSNTLTEFANNIAMNGNTINVNNSTLYLADTNVTDVYAFGQGSNVILGGTVGITSIRSPITILAGDLKINGNQIQASTGDVNIDMTGAELTRFAGDIQIDGNDILVGGGITHISMIGSQKAVFVGDIQIGGNDIIASDGNVNISMASSSRTSIVGQLRIESNQIVDGADHLNMTLGTNYVAFTDDIRINGDSIRASDNTINITLESGTRTILAGNLQLGTNIIEASDGAQSIEVTPVTGSVGIKSDLVVDNSVFIKGTELTVRSSSVRFRDRLIDIGLGIDTTSNTGLTVPTQDDNKDSGILLNYYNGAARKAAVFWDDSRSSVGIASIVTESSEILSVVGYAKIDVANITINDCAGSSDLLSCDSTTSTRNLVNVVIDGGSY